MTHTHKSTHVYKILLVFILVLSSFSSVLGFSFITSLNEVGGGTQKSYGTHQAFSYGGNAYIVKGDTIYRYSEATWQYIGSNSFSGTIRDLHLRGDTLYISITPTVYALDMTNNFAPIANWTPNNVTSITSFDVNDDHIIIAGSGGVEVIDKNTGTIFMYDGFNTGSSVIRFTVSGESFITSQYGGPQNINARMYATSNGFLLDTLATGTSSAIARSMVVSPTHNVMVLNHYGGGVGATVRTRVFNFSDSGFGSLLAERTSGSYIPSSASGNALTISNDGSLFAHTDERNLVYLRVTSSQTLLGTSNSGATFYDTRWTYVDPSNTYMIASSSHNTRVYYTGVAPPLLTTNTVKMLQGSAVELSMTIVREGDSTEISCTNVYRIVGSDEWVPAGSYRTFNVSYFSELPETIRQTIFNLDSDVTYETAASCLYENDEASGTQYGLIRQFQYQRPPFNPFEAIMNNFGTVMWLTFTLFVIVALASKGLGNMYAILAVTVLLSVVGAALSILALTTVIFIIIASIAFAIISGLLGGNA